MTKAKAAARINQWPISIGPVLPSPSYLSQLILLAKAAPRNDDLRAISQQAKDGEEQRASEDREDQCLSGRPFHALDEQKHSRGASERSCKNRTDHRGIQNA